MSFSQGLISGLYGGMKIQGTSFFHEKLFNRDGSVKTTVIRYDDNFFQTLDSAILQLHQ